MKRSIYVSDTTLRDGEQRPGCVFSEEQKLQLARLLDRAGVHRIDAGVPAMGEAECDLIRRIVRQRARAQIATWNRMNPQDIRQAMSCEPDIIHISVPVSYIHIYSKLKKNKAWLLREMEGCVKLALSGGFTVTVGLEDASRADITFVSGIAKQFGEMGVSGVQFSDTVGILTPSRTYECMQEMRQHGSPPISFHGHNDLGMAVANSLAALRAGAVAIEGTLYGIGERAGNCDLQELILAAASQYEMRPTVRDVMLLYRGAEKILKISEK